MSSLTPGFADPVLDAQRTFRQLLEAMARPGRVYSVAAAPAAAVAGLDPASVAVCLTVLDFETVLFLGGSARQASIAEYLRFHCNCPLTATPAQAAFALLAGNDISTGLDAFDPGSDEYPDRSTTVIWQVDSLDSGPEQLLRGPGIDGQHRLRVSGLPDWLWQMWPANQARFPRGIDIILCAGERVAALPRTVQIHQD